MLSLRALTILSTSFAGALAAAAVREVTSFPIGVWLENLAVRSNGALLATRIDKGEVISIDPRTGAQKVVLSFPNTTSALGIAEVSPDVFAIATGNYSTTSGSTPGSYAIWTLDLRPKTPRAKQAAAVPSAANLNGVAALDGAHVLVADSINGVVYKVGLRTGKHSVVLSGDAYQAPPPPAFQLGVNGLSIRHGTLYFTNSGAGTLARVPLQGGKVEVLADGLELPDDFALTPAGDAFVTLNTVRSVVRLALRSGSKRTQVAGGPESEDFATPTAARFGRTRKDRETLYVVTGGVRDETGNALSAAKVLAVDVSSFSQ
ncbi:NHL repeat-containing protein [Auricularia subglabra TFB-10046 SS5]|nr:NHL repeat-containing protein [Auricularia subglabra TFB-10046 SS5]